MGLLDGLVKGLAGKFLGGGAQQNPLLEIAMGLLTNPQTGGLSGLVETFTKKGLGDAMGSWISTGQNLPVTGEQIQHVLGGDQIQQIAQKLGASGQEVSGGLASLLPGIIDKLTPNGKLPEQDSLQQALGMLSKTLSNR
jgi:uncharacterized protein YidB (DUF937 family)